MRRSLMVKVKSFTSEIKVFQTMRELRKLDDEINKFIVEQKVKKVISVNDACTTDNAGTIGIIRVLAYE
jgi:hypothetical protein